MGTTGSWHHAWHQEAWCYVAHLAALRPSAGPLPWPQLPHLQNEKLCLMSPQASRSRTCACAPGVHPPATLSPGDSRATVSG